MLNTPTLAALADDLKNGRTTARKLVDDCLANIAEKSGEGPRALTCRIGNPRETILDQLARGGASSIEVGGQAGECRMVRHGVLDYFLCDLPWRGLSPMTGWHTSALARRECGHATAPLLGPLTEIGQCRIKTATSG